MKKIGCIFSLLAILAGIIAFIICSNLGIGIKDFFNRGDITYSSVPYAMKTEYQEFIENVTERVDLYVERKKNDSSEYQAIYSYDFMAGVDLKNNPPTISKTNDTVYLPYPTISSVDQTDGEDPLVLLERDGLDIKDIEAAKIAMENIAKDYAYRSDIVDRSAELLKQYFTEMDTLYVYNFKNSKSKNNHFEEKIEIANVGLCFSFFPELLKGSYGYEICGDEYSRNFITFIDKKSNKKVFTISYWYYTHKDYDETVKDFEDVDKLIIRDPINPKEKLLVYGYSRGDALIQFDNDVFYSEMHIQGEDAKSKYFPDVIYLLSTLHKSEENTFSESYRSWIDNYDRCIENINMQQFSKAKDNLTIMKNLCDKECNDALYMRDLVNALGDYSPEYCVNDDEKFSVILHGFYDIKYDGKTDDGSQYRRKLLSFLSDTNYGADSKQQLERYYLRKYSLDAAESHEYKNDLIETGKGIDKAVIESFSTEEFLKFMNNSWHAIIRQHYEGKFSAQNINEYFKPNKVDKNILLIKDLYNVEKDKYGSPEEIIEELVDNGLSSIYDEPLFIIVFQQDHSYFSGLDKDALVYKKDGIMYFANYDGIFDKDGRFVKYEDVKIKDEKQGIIDMPIKDKYDLHAPLACKLLLIFKEAYRNNTQVEIKDVILKRLQNEIISITNDNIYWVKEPINVNME